MQRRLLSSFIGVKHYEDNARSAILVDFCYYNLLFCEENELTPEQTSAFFSIMKQVFEHAFETKVRARATLDDRTRAECVCYVLRMLRQACGHRFFRRMLRWRRIMLSSKRRSATPPQLHAAHPCGSDGRILPFYHSFQLMIFFLADVGA